MYNRYLNAQRCTPAPVCPSPEPDCGCAGAKKQPAGAGGLLQTLGDRLGDIRFDSDTLIALVVVWFLLSDGEATDTDLLIIVFVLLVLGL